jgi:hypothetical protein
MKVYVEVYSGKGGRSHILFAQVHNAETDELVVNATLTYVLKVIESRNYQVVLRTK